MKYASCWSSLEPKLCLQALEMAVLESVAVELSKVNPAASFQTQVANLADDIFTQEEVLEGTHLCDRVLSGERELETDHEQPVSLAKHRDQSPDEDPLIGYAYAQTKLTPS